MASTVSVPGCVTLGGSHALVTDGPIVSAAIDTRLRIRLDRGGDDIVGIDSPFGTQRFSPTALLDGDGGDPADGAELAVAKGGRTVSGRAVLSAVVRALECSADEIAGLRFHIERADSFPLGVGLSSSPALVVGCLATTATVCGRSPSRFELAELAVDVEETLWEHPHPVHPYAIAQGGVVHGDRPSEPTPFSAPLLIGLPEASRSRAAVADGCRAIRERIGERYGTVLETANRCTDAIEAAARAGDRSRMAAELAFAGGLDEPLGVLSPRSRAVRSQMLSHDDSVGVKQSDVGQRAVVLAMPPEGAGVADARRPLSGTGTETIETAISETGLRYEERAPDDR
jgi:mevalonate kinase